jgi:hypothetical protein
MTLELTGLQMTLELTGEISGRVFHLAVDNLKELIDGLLQMGASVSETYHDQVTDVVVDYRKGALYKKAEQEQKRLDQVIGYGKSYRKRPGLIQNLI